MADRAEVIATILQEVADVARELAGGRSRPFGEVRLTRNQLDALFILAHSSRPVTAGALAARLGLTPGAVTQLVAGLREHGLAETVVDTDDGRVRVVRLTGPARSQVGEFERDAVARLSPRFDGLTTAQLERLAGLLARAETHER